MRNASSAHSENRHPSYTKHVPVKIEVYYLINSIQFYMYIAKSQNILSQELESEAEAYQHFPQ